MPFPSQVEADELLKLPKHYTGHVRFRLPSLGMSHHIQIFAEDKREKFILDVTSHRINLSKRTFQTRAVGSIVLARLDLNGPPHRNPDGAELPCPHLHVYRAGFHDKWAVPPPESLNGIENPLHLLNSFMEFCNIVTKPEFESDLFS